MSLPSQRIRIEGYDSVRRSVWRLDPERQAILLRGRRSIALSAEVKKVLDDLKLSRHCPLTSRGVSGSKHAVPDRGVQPSKASTRSVTSFGSPDLPGLAKDTDTEELPQASFQRIRGAAQPKEPLGSLFHNGNAKQHARWMGDAVERPHMFPGCVHTNDIVRE
jgi:hypothetical protein